MAIRGANCTLTVPGNGAGTGQRQVVCTRLSHGIKFEANESEARNKRILYPTRQSTGSFTLTLQFSKHKEYEGFNIWLVAYGRAMSASMVPVGMRVQVPGSGFDKRGVLQTGVTFGDSHDALTWTNNLQFVGVEDSISFKSSLLSKFLLPRNQEEISQFFYPASLDQAMANAEAEVLQRSNAAWGARYQAEADAARPIRRTGRAF